MQKKHSLSQHSGTLNFTIYIDDNEIEAIYLKIRNNKIYKSEEIGSNGEAVIDLDRRGQVVGIEMLEPGRVTVREIRNIQKKYNIPELQHLNINKLHEVFI